MIDGRKLRAFRLARAATGSDVARELGVTKQTIRSRERSANVGLKAAEAYLNAVLKLSGRRERVTIEIAVSVPMGSTDLYADLVEAIS
jgi:DNA-binding XRE family transcriptional regulator